MVEETGGEKKEKGRASAGLVDGIWAQRKIRCFREQREESKTAEEGSSSYVHLDEVQGISAYGKVAWIYQLPYALIEYSGPRYWCFPGGIRTARGRKPNAEG